MAKVNLAQRNDVSQTATCPSDARIVNDGSLEIASSDSIYVISQLLLCDVNSQICVAIRFARHLNSTCPLGQFYPEIRTSL